MRGPLPDRSPSPAGDGRPLWFFGSVPGSEPGCLARSFRSPCIRRSLALRARDGSCSQSTSSARFRSLMYRGSASPQYYRPTTKVGTSSRRTRHPAGDRRRHHRDRRTAALTALPIWHALLAQMWSTHWTSNSGCRVRDQDWMAHGDRPRRGCRCRHPRRWSGRHVLAGTTCWIESSTAQILLIGDRITGRDSTVNGMFEFDSSEAMASQP